MATNDTVSESLEARTMIHVLYGAEGRFVATVNFLTVAVVLRHKMLRERKENWIIAGLAMADTLSGLAYATAGVYRSKLIFAGQDSILVSSWYCMTTLHCLFFSTGGLLSGIMLLCVSVDRLIATAFPLKYFKFNDKRYGLYLLSVFYVPALLCSLFGIYISYNEPDTKRHPAICYTNHAYGNDSLYHHYFWLIAAWASVVSVILYVFVVVIYKKKKAVTVQNQQNNNQKLQQDLKRQRKLMTTLGFSSVCTLFFYVIPNLVFTYAPARLVDSLYKYANIIININPAVNFFLFTIRHRDLRLGLKYLFLNKHMNPNAASVINN